MRFFKLIDIEKNIIIKAIKDDDIICMEKSLNGYIAVKRPFSSIDYAICVDNALYIIADKNYEDSGYPKVQLDQISLDEFNELLDLLNSQNNTANERLEIPTVIRDTVILDTAKTLKINQLKADCNEAITNGIDINYNGTMTKHFDLTVEDQLNLTTLRYQIITETENTFAYHSKNDAFEYYSKEEIVNIIKAVDKHILYHTAYFNSIKRYIESLSTVSEVNAVKYGDDFPDMFKSSVLLAISDK